MAKKKNDKKLVEKNKSEVATIGNELKKVSWPNASELSKSTASVIFLVIIVALIIFLSDTLFSLGFKKITEPIIEKQKKEQNIGDVTNLITNAETVVEEKPAENSEQDKNTSEEKTQEENKEQ